MKGLPIFIFSSLALLSSCNNSFDINAPARIKSLAQISGSVDSASLVELTWSGIDGPTTKIVIGEVDLGVNLSCASAIEIPNTSTYSVTGLSPDTEYSFVLCDDFEGVLELASNQLTLKTTRNIQALTLQTLVKPTAFGTSDTFGSNVAVSGNKSLVSFIDPYVYNYVVYAFELDPTTDTWTYTQLLKSTVDHSSVYPDEFGTSVKLLKDRALIGASSHLAQTGSTQAGAAFYYEHNGSNWVEKKILYAPDVTATEYFGVSLGLWDNQIYVGSLQNAGMGAVYVYEGSDSTWTQVRKITASDGTPSMKFGLSMAITKEDVIVGAEDAVYLYGRTSNLTSETKLVNTPDPLAVNFGTSIAAYGNYLAISDPQYDSTRGRVYIYRKTAGTWNLHEELTSPVAGGTFGTDVAMDHSTLLVGAPAEDNLALNTGAIYIFERSELGWVGSKKITSLVPTVGVSLGRKLSLSGNTFMSNGLQNAFMIDDSYVSPP